jgi:hypothetical protein
MCGLEGARCGAHRARGHRGTVSKREVGLAHAAPAELVMQRGGGGGVEREEQDATCVHVEAVDDLKHQ